MKLLIILLIIFFVAVFIVFAESMRECRLLNTTVYEIDTKGVFSNEAPVTIAVLADLHNSFSNEGERIIGAVKKERPDIIIAAGDMLLSHSDQQKKNKKTAELMNRLCEIAPVFYGMGNHETAVSDRSHLKHLWPDFLNNLKNKETLLRNESKNICVKGKKINICGLELPEKYYKRFNKLKPTGEEIDNLIGKSDNDAYNILIAHNPDFYEQYAKWGADLILSGHNHGGMVRIPFFGGVISPRPAIFPKYDYGLFQEEAAIMIVSGGLGSHSIKIRLNNKPELVIVKLA
ncbi:MAG: metallophosphoesterase [Clostridium sp.]|nr:metallophosphoesterase [Clostridium sp.]